MSTNIDTSHLERFLEWQVSSFDSVEAKELSQFLQENRDRYNGQVNYLQRAEAEKRIRRTESDRYRRIGAWLAARRAVDKIVKETILGPLLERVWINYRNKRDGTAIEISEVNVQGLTRTSQTSRKTNCEKSLAVFRLTFQKRFSRQASRLVPRC